MLAKRRHAARAGDHGLQGCPSCYATLVAITVEKGQEGQASVTMHHELCGFNKSNLITIILEFGKSKSRPVMVRLFVLSVITYSRKAIGSPLVLKTDQFSFWQEGSPMQLAASYCREGL